MRRRRSKRQSYNVARDGDGVVVGINLREHVGVVFVPLGSPGVVHERRHLEPAKLCKESSVVVRAIEGTSN